MKCLLNQEFTDFELTSFFFSFYLNYSKFICIYSNLPLVLQNNYCHILLFYYLRWWDK